MHGQQNIKKITSGIKRMNFERAINMVLPYVVSTRKSRLEMAVHVLCAAIFT